MTDHLGRVSALPGVDSAVAAARAAIDRLLAQRVLRRRSAEVTAECALRSARASAALEGVNVALSVVRGGAGPPVVIGAMRLQAELGALVGVWERSPRQALARMHLLAARGIASDASIGRPRGWAADAAGPTRRRESAGPAGEGPPGSTGPRGPRGPRRPTDLYERPPTPGPIVPDDPLGLGPALSPGETAARMDGLVELLLAPTTAPAVVVAAIVHAEILAVRPFGQLDGLVARSAARLVLLGRGLDPKGVSAPDVGHFELGEEYAPALRGYVEGGHGGVAAWVIHCARAIELGAREGLAVCEALRRAQ